MARNHARLHVSAYDMNEGITDLPIAAQGLYLMLLARRDVSLCGVLPLKPKVWASRAADTDEEHIWGLLNVLEGHGKVIIDHDTDEVWIRTFIYHDQVLAMPQVAMVMAGQFDSIDSVDIKLRIVRSLPPSLRTGFPANLRRGRKEVAELLQKADAANYKPPQENPSDMPCDNPCDMGFTDDVANPSGMGSGKGAGTGTGLGKGTGSV